MSRSKAEKILQQIEKIADTKYLPIIGPKKGSILVDLVHRTKPKRILEIGTFIGYSTILIAKELESDVEIITIEIHEDEVEVARENIRNAEVKPKIILLTGNALNLLPKLTGTFDMVFLDAEKTKYFDYLKLIEGKLRIGSVLAADNAGFYANQMKDYLIYVRTSGKYTSQYISENGDGIEVSEKL
jgi:predicted O-methyltransferase YrrM